MKEIIKALKKKLPKDLDTFYIVGGFVRDYYLGNLDFNDIDIVWPVKEEFISQYFNEAFLIKESTKTFIAPVYVENKKIKVEITPLKFPTIEEDLLSRDLTINSVALKILRNTDKPVWLDPSGGIDDLYYKCLRCVNEKNILDDPIRMLRIFRFQSKLNYYVDSDTLDNIRKNKTNIHQSPKEMICSELLKLFQGNYCEKALRNMVNTGLLQEIIPEFKMAVHFKHQDKHHKYETVFEHSMRVLRNCREYNLDTEHIMAALFHDLKKPDVFDGKHYLNHEILSASTTRDILKRLKFPNKIINEVFTIIKYHMIPLNSLKKVNEMRYLMGRERFEKQIRFINSDKRATKSNWLTTDRFINFNTITEEVLKSDSFFTELDHLVNGDLLLNLGLKQCIGIKRIIEFLRNYFFKHPKTLSETRVFELLKSNLAFNESYQYLKYKKEILTRKVEYIFDDKVIGLLTNGESLTFKTGIFEYNYLSEGEFEQWLSKKEKKYSLFFSY